MKKTCVIGFPVDHSRSPIIHNYWLKHYGIESTYEKISVSPEDLPAFMAELPLTDYLGFNVTIPHKERIIPLLLEVDQISKALAAVNTVYFRNGKFLGTNTDGEGFIANVKEVIPDFRFKGKNAVIIGAGGAAKAIIGALLGEAVSKIGVINRTPHHAFNLKNQFGSQITHILPRQINFALRDCDILINTTSLGMTGQPELDLDISHLKPQAVVADIVYVPMKTELLRRAQQRGHTIVYGLGMLLHQAVRGFSLWYGVKPEVTDELFTLVRDDIERRKK